ncbi:Predicted transcriptional regulator [gamma proteobacterium HdN1]|nr:Predicted transcriptional regulator [gamma proteobacterium HdN1]
MLRIGKLTDYALILMNCMATRPAQLWRMELLADTTRLPQPTVRKLMGQLVAANLVRSERGARGGYQLSRLPNLISMAEIIIAIEGPIAITECCEVVPSCERLGACDMEGRWPAINDLILQLLRVVTLSDIQFTQDRRMDVAVLLERLQHRSCPYPA